MRLPTTPTGGPYGVPSITCPRCLFTSYHPVDIAEGYCGNCSDWTSRPATGGAADPGPFAAHLFGHPRHLADDERDLLAADGITTDAQLGADPATPPGRTARHHPARAGAHPGLPGRPDRTGVPMTAKTDYLIAQLRAQAMKLPEEGHPVVMAARRSALAAVDVAAAALAQDPTLADDDRCGNLDLFAEILRQLKPLARQAQAELQHRLLCAQPDTPARQEALDRLGKTAHDAPAELSDLLERCAFCAQRIQAAALPDWNTPHRIRERSEQLLPGARTLRDIAEQLRTALAPSLALPYPAPEAQRLADLADQISPAAADTNLTDAEWAQLIISTYRDLVDVDQVARQLRLPRSRVLAILDRAPTGTSPERQRP